MVYCFRMTESEFWDRLEFRICTELQGSPQKPLNWLWCDGLVADRYEFTADPPRIEGRAWFGQTGNEQWTFTLTLPRAIHSMDDIDWTTLMPAQDDHGWLRVDEARKVLRINATMSQLQIEENG
jgi:hypothetical protein